MAFESNSYHNRIDSDLDNVLVRHIKDGRQIASTSFGLVSIKSTAGKLTNREVNRICKDAEYNYKKKDLVRERLQRKLNQRVENQ